MSITTTDLYDGGIFHTNAYPFEEDATQSKPRPIFVISTNRHSVIARGVFTNPGRDRKPISADHRNSLHHDGYLDNRLVEIPIRSITHYIGDTDPYFDPYDDFTTAA